MNLLVAFLVGWFKNKLSHSGGSFSDSGVLILILLDEHNLKSGHSWRMRAYNEL
jgi:hypothetical protein